MNRKIKLRNILKKNFMKKPLIISIALVAVLSYAIFVLASSKKPEVINNSNQSEIKDSGIILFYGDGCPHCAIVEEYVSKNGIEAKVPFVKKEVYNNKQNSAELVEKASACGMPTDSIGVPFLWDGEKCLTGDQDIVEFFSARSGSASGGKQ